MKNIYIIVSLLSMLLISCEKEVEVEIQDNDPKIVVSTHIGAGENIRVYVSSSIPLYNEYNNQNNKIADAIVEVSSDNIQWKSLHYNAQDYNYSLSLSEFYPSEGGTYYVRASANGYKSVKSNCSIPYFNPIHLTLAKIDTSNSEIRITFKVKDAVGQNNYYGIKAYGFYGMQPQSYELYTENSSPWVFSDNIGDGSEFVFTFKGYYWQQIDSIKVRLYQTSESFYRFHSSYENYVSDNPFSEPSPIYSNIENGLGICSGYTYRDYSFTFHP